MKILALFCLLMLASCAQEKTKKSTSDAPKPPPMSEEVKQQDSIKEKS